MRKTISLVFVLVLALASISLAIEDTWTQKADMPTARSCLSTSVVNGKIYAIGGIKNANSAPLSTVEEYNPQTDTWTTKSNMPTARISLFTSVVNGKIYAIGGGPRVYGSGLSTVEEYDPVSDTWTTKSDMPTARFALSATEVNGKIYAIGGKPRHGASPLSTVEEYDPATDTWTAKADMPTARWGLSTCAVNGKIYAIGGDTGNSDATYVGLPTIEEYDPVMDTWTKKSNMPTARGYLSASAVNGKIYAIGGALKINTSALSTVEEYDPVTDTWTTKADMPIRRFFLASSAVNNKIYAIGGAVATWPWPGCPTVEEYDAGFTIPAPDFNGDWKVDIEDLIVLIEHWGTDEPLCDIAPQPFGDGIVDALDLEVLMSHWGQEILDPALMSYWKLDETEGNIAYDSVDARDGVVIGEAIWQPDAGKVNGTLQFDGIDDYVRTPIILNPYDGPFSVFAWVKGGAPSQAVLSQAGGARWLCADPSEGNLMTELKGPGRSAGPLFSQTNITDGNWHHIGFVWDGSHRTLYVDDVAVAEDTQDGLEGSDKGLYIGTGMAMEPGSFWSSLIDDVRIYNRAVIP